MASTLNASTSSNGIVQTADASGILNIQSNGVNTNAQAWVSFNGSATPTIRASYNVTSITFVATGTFTINFTNALSDTNYATIGSCESNGSGVNSRDLTFQVSYLAAKTTTAVQVNSYSQNAGAQQNATVYNVAVFR